jgi:hypothetical protein
MPKLHLDLTRPRHPRSVLAWVILLGGVCAALAVAGSYQQVHEHHQTLLAQQQRLDASAKSAQALRQTPEVAAPMAVALTKAQTQLQQPWSALLAALAAATEASSVGLISLDLESNGRTLRFSADARDFKSAVQCIQALHDDPLVDRVSLTSHEVRDDPSGARLRFQAELKYKAAQ